MKVTKIVIMAVTFLFASQAAHAALGEIERDEVKPGAIVCAAKELKDRKTVAAAEENQTGQANINSAL